MISLASPGGVVNRSGGQEKSGGFAAARKRGANRPPSLERYRNKSTYAPSDTAREIKKRRGREYRQLMGSLMFLGWREKAAAVRSCGSLSVWECGACDGVAARKRFTCDFRLCPYCADRRGQDFGDRLGPVVAGFARPAVLVLTIKNRFSLGEADKHLRSSWQKLSRRVEFRRAFAGGFVFQESTYNPRFGWHTHLHCLVDGRMPQKRLAELWLECTGDSMVCHISAIAPTSQQKAISEACKYPCKLGDLNGEPQLVREYIEYFRGRRLAWSWGSCYGRMKEIEAEIKAARDAAINQEQVEGDAVYCPHCRGYDTMKRVIATWAWYDAQQISSGWWVRGLEGT